MYGCTINAHNLWYCKAKILLVGREPVHGTLHGRSGVPFAVGGEREREGGKVGPSRRECELDLAHSKWVYLIHPNLGIPFVVQGSSN